MQSTGSVPTTKAWTCSIVRKPLGLKCHYHPPSVEDTGLSCSPSVGFGPSLHAHLALDSSGARNDGFFRIRSPLRSVRGLQRARLLADRIARGWPAGIQFRGMPKSDVQIVWGRVCPSGPKGSTEGDPNYTYTPSSGQLRCQYCQASCAPESNIALRPVLHHFLSLSLPFAACRFSDHSHFTKSTLIPVWH